MNDKDTELIWEAYSEAPITTYTLQGEYRGMPGEVARISFEPDIGTIFYDGVNGDDTDYDLIKAPIEEVIRVGEEVGLWHNDGGGDLHEIDFEAWDEFFNRFDGRHGDMDDIPAKYRDV